MSAAEPARRAVRLEIAGVAGAGKSTLTQVLCEQHARWELADSLHTRARRHFPYVARSIPRVASLVAAGVGAAGPTWDEIKDVLYVSEWHRYLADHAGPHGVVSALDQGPVFALARFRVARHPFTRTRAFDAWWTAMVQRWSRELDVIVWLDAPDTVLWERINARTQAHETKGGTAEDSREFITRYRSAFQEILAEMSEAGHPAVLRFDTAEQAAEDIAAEIVAWLSTASPDARAAGGGAK